MCLMLVQYKSDYKIRPRSRRATENIVVYKRLKWLDYRNCYVSPIETFYYPKGKVIKIKKFGIEFDWHFRKWIINEGLHAYKDKASAENCAFGFEKVFKFVIPKGTLYYESGNEIVSLAIKRIN